MNANTATPHMSYPNKVYPSKRDWWIVGLLWLSIAFCVASMIYIFYALDSIAIIIVLLRT